METFSSLYATLPSDSLHDALRSSFTNTVDHAAASDEQLTPRHQVYWFQDDLPEALCILIKRFDRHTKLHTKMTFPKRLALDRYMQENKSEVSRIRLVEDKLAHTIAKLEEKLKNVERFGANGESVPVGTTKGARGKREKMCQRICRDDQRRERAKR